MMSRNVPQGFLPSTTSYSSQSTLYSRSLASYVSSCMALMVMTSNLGTVMELLWGRW